MKMRTDRAAIACFIWAGFLFVSSAHASAIPWRNTVYSHISDGEGLAELLRDFCAGQELNGVVSETIQGCVSGRFIRIPPAAFLKNICMAHGLLWYYDGGRTLYFYRSDEQKSEVVLLRQLSFVDLEEALEGMGVLDTRFPLQPLKGSNAFYVSGPPHFVETVVNIALKLDEKGAFETEATATREEVKVFPLKHAWAADLTFSFMDSELTVLGVATILRNLFSEGDPGRQPPEARLRLLPRTVEKLKGKGLISVGRSADDVPPYTEGDDAGTKQREVLDLAERTVAVRGGSFVMADTRLNAVIVKDTEERMPFYEEMIPLLDRPVGLVQIQATIMDINADSLHELGVTWRFRGEGTAKSLSKDAAIVTEGGLDVDETFTPESGDLVVGPGFNFATLLGTATDYFLARVRALEQEGKARVLSQPSVLTLDNMAALLEHSQTFYVRVPGDREVDLFSVTAGIVLKVTPHIVEEDDGIKIKLAVNIEDGNLSPTREVDDIPIVQTSSVNTQAVVRQDQSLLIGGYFHESHFTMRSGVPCLLSLPLFNVLFKQDQAVSKKAERMFLITPKIILNDVYSRNGREGGNQGDF